MTENTPNRLTTSESSVFLRPFVAEDADTIWNWHNSAELYRSLLGQFRKVEPSATKRWLQEQMNLSPDKVAYAICETSSDRHIGNVYLREIDRSSLKAEFHMFIGAPVDRGKGYGKQALKLLLDHAFTTLGLRRIYLFVLADNQPAIDLYRSCNFVEEGRLRAHVLKDGVFKDVLVMGLNQN